MVVELLGASVAGVAVIAGRGDFRLALLAALFFYCGCWLEGGVFEPWIRGITGQKPSILDDEAEEGDIGEGHDYMHGGRLCPQDMWEEIEAEDLDCEEKAYC